MTAGLVSIASFLMAGDHSYAQFTDEIEPVHALAIYGDPKHGPDFEHFDWVNPRAPKGGTMRLGSRGTFDSFHPFITKGVATSTGSVESLMVANPQEKFTMYGLIAESAEVPEDRSWVIFNLRKEARWHDGMPITADDVVWTFNMLVEHNPSYRNYYSSVDRAVKLGERRAGFVFKEGENRELPLILSQLPVLPRHYWAQRDFSKTTLEPPLGSGPYRVKEFEPGRYRVLERVEDYWGRDLAVNQGQNNFDEMRTDYYRDDTAIRLALKSGVIDYRYENQSKAWAADYDVPAVEKGWLKKELIRHENPTGMQAFIMNTRRDLFKNPKVRQALAYAFDFEWSNETLFHGQYARTESYFSNSDFASRGLPQGEELEILERFRDRLPPEVFGQSYRAPKTDGSGWPRENLKTAFDLLKQAGWEVRDLKLVHKDTGESMEFEILLVSQAFERIVLPFTRNLARLGIEARVRLVDQSQYYNRVGQFDFDMLVGGWGQSDSPGNEQLSYWSSQAADVPHSRNYAGIKDPVVDELIRFLIQAPTSESLVMRTRALDRALLAGHYVIPNWHAPFDRVLYWDRFSRPSKPMKSGVYTSRWWHDAGKAQILEERIAGDEAALEVAETAPANLTGLAAGLAIAVALLIYLGIRRRWRRAEA